MGPLTGITVIDFTRVLSGPYCTMILGDLGARVIKLEHPGRGDDTRRWGPPFLGDESAYFLSVNRNKESVAVDFKTPGGRELVERLLAQADVVVENFRPGTLDGVGLDAATVRRAHPRIVYCSISGYGQTGPRRDEPGYDAVMQAEGGLMSITGAADGPPYRLGVAIVDIVSGMFAAQGVLAALLARERTGEGQVVDLGMLDATTALLTYQAGNYFATGAAPGRLGNRHPTIAPYETFATADGDLALAVGNDSLWQRFCQAAELPELGADPRFATNAGRLAHYDALKPTPRRRLRAAEPGRLDRPAARRRRPLRRGAHRRGGVRRSADGGAADGGPRLARVARRSVGHRRPGEALGDPGERAAGPAGAGPTHCRSARRAGLRSSGRRRVGVVWRRTRALMDIALLRKSLVKAIESARRDAAERRGRADEANRRYERFLEDTATPVFRAMAQALRAEGLQFDVITPSGGVRLGPERTREDGIELGLDATVDPPEPIVRVVRSRGSRVMQHERPVAGEVRLEGLTEDHVATMLLDELRPWIER